MATRCQFLLITNLEGYGSSLYVKFIVSSSRSQRQNAKFSRNVKLRYAVSPVL